MARSKPFVNLKSLYIGENNISDIGAVALIKSSSFPKLETLDMVKNRLGEETLIAVHKHNNGGKIHIITR